MPELNPLEKQAIEMADKIAEAIFPELRPRPVRTSTAPVPTPGDWKYDARTGDIYAILDGSKYIVAWTDSDSCLTEEEQAANGRLMTQSKVLAAIVRDLIAAWDKCDSNSLQSLIFRAKLAISLTEVR